MTARPGWGALALLAACTREEAARPETSPHDASPRAQALQVRQPAASAAPRIALRVRAAGTSDPAASPAPGEVVRLDAGSAVDADLGLAVRVRAAGPAYLAADPEGGRVVYALLGQLRVSVSADPAARPFALALATPCGVLTVSRAAELAIGLADAKQCVFSLAAGTATLTQAGQGLDERTSLAVGRALGCAVGSACVDMDPPVPSARAEGTEGGGAEPLAPYRALLADQLDGAARAVSAMRAGERRAVAQLEPGVRSDAARAIQQQLARSAADTLRARVRLENLRHVYRATGLATQATMGDDPHDRAVEEALRGGS